MGKPRVNTEWAKYYADRKRNHPVIVDLALDLQDVRKERDDFKTEIDRLVALINHPHTNSFLDAVRLEAAHQRERWAAEHDSGKTDADWLWLIGHLVGKAIHKPEKQLHHIVTSAAACLNWHMQRTVGNDMRPGIKEPA